METANRKLIHIWIPEIIYKRYKESGIKSPKVFEFGLEYPAVSSMLQRTEEAKLRQEEALIRVQRDNLRLAQIVDYQKKQIDKLQEGEAK